MSSPRFTPKALAFLRSLKRNNRREWFQPRKDDYETLVRAPMIEVIERLAVDFKAFAPELLANPKTSLFRIYRDTRFSEDKSPYKTHVAAVFPHRDLPKLGGAALYFHVAPDEVWVGGGLHTPDSSQLQVVREHLAGNLRRFRTVVEAPSFKRAVGRLEGEQLQKVPRGFPPDHEAADYLRMRQFLAGKGFPAALAATPRFYPSLLGVFKTIAPLIRFLNEPLLKRARP